MDRIARDLTDEAILRNLLREERAAAVACRCTDQRLHVIGCQVAELIRERRHDIDRRKIENARLCGAVA
jgi:hypothetical protein